MDVIRIRLGYVAIALNLPKTTSSSQFTYARYKKIISDEKRINELKRVTRSNIEDLRKILQYNIDNKIHFYRLTSKLIPLATHPEVYNWKYRKYFKIEFKRIGSLINKYNMRIDTHPDHFNVLNSLNEEVVSKTKKELLTHYLLFKDMHYLKGKMIIHVGSGQKGKEDSIKRFIKNFKELPIEISSRIILENDDKLFTSKDVLYICEDLNIPMVLDVHHHRCNNCDDNIEDIIPRFLNTWNNEYFPPKIHISSPKEGNKDRKHADYIIPNDFIEFIEKCLDYNKDIDVMIEAKNKDLALFKLVKDIKKLKPDWKWIDSSTLEI